jgi:hypothetical protein
MYPLELVVCQTISRFVTVASDSSRSANPRSGLHSKADCCAKPFMNLSHLKIDSDIAIYQSTRHFSSLPMTSKVEILPASRVAKPPSAARRALEAIRQDRN